MNRNNIKDKLIKLSAQIGRAEIMRSMGKTDVLAPELHKLKDKFRRLSNTYEKQS